MLKPALERGQRFLLGGQNPLEVPFQAERCKARRLVWGLGNACCSWRGNGVEGSVGPKHRGSHWSLNLALYVNGSPKALSQRTDGKIWFRKEHSEGQDRSPEPKEEAGQWPRQRAVPQWAQLWVWREGVTWVQIWAWC